MKHTLAVLLVTTANVASPLAGPPAAGRGNAGPPPPGTSTLKGHVVAADSGQPLRKAQGRITAGGIRENRVATTAAGGLFEFKELRAGRYFLTASKGGFVNNAYGQLRPTDA